MSTESLFHAFGAATSKALSEETSLVLGTSNSCLPTERSEARPVIAATGGHRLRYVGWVSTANYMMDEEAEFELDPSLDQQPVEFVQILQSLRFFSTHAGI